MGAFFYSLVCLPGEVTKTGKPFLIVFNRFGENTGYFFKNLADLGYFDILFGGNQVGHLATLLISVITNVLLYT
jgi:hypothetical protein